MENVYEMSFDVCMYTVLFELLSEWNNNRKGVERGYAEEYSSRSSYWGINHKNHENVYFISKSVKGEPKCVLEKEWHSHHMRGITIIIWTHIGTKRTLFKFKQLRVCNLLHFHKGHLMHPDLHDLHPSINLPLTDYICTVKVLFRK